MNETVVAQEGSPEIAKGTTPFERAREIMGERLLGPAEVKQVFGIEIEEIPPIPFPEEILEKLKDSCRLIIYADKFSDGTPVTALSITERFVNQKADGTPLISNFATDDWKRRENFFTKETPALRWRLVSDDIIPDSTNKNYLEQTKALADFVESQYADKDAIPQDIQEMIVEARALAGDADFQAKVVSQDETEWKPAAEKLANLSLNQTFRDSFVELLYRLVLVDRAKAEQLLAKIYSWTNSRSSDGNLVYGGSVGSDGVRVIRYEPGYSGSIIGLPLSATKF